MKMIPTDLFKGRRFFDDFWAPMTWDENFMEEFFAPRVDVKDCKDHYEIEAELPGVKKDDIKVSLVDGVLVLEAEARKDETEEEAGKYVRKERHYGKLMRRFSLGSDVKEEEIDARFEDGVLKLRAPKRDVEAVAETHRIAIH
ncbi:MAG: Hsp20/alpha crystallin family protein [Gammaproteobacteria bacterium]|nr:Hsp20/alpha crystallin family protein [Gammaproteobacteria bacterium]